MNRTRIATLALVFLVVGVSTGCASVGVQAWERDLHAREDMLPDELEAGIDDHIYFSKEASSGGRGFAGGGCGCN